MSDNHPSTHSTRTPQSESPRLWWMREREEEEKSWRVKLDDVKDWQLHWCVDKARLRCSFSFFSYSHSLKKKEKLSRRIFLSLSLSSLCVFVYPPASSGFVLFNGCLFSHLYRYTYCMCVCVYYCSYSGLFSVLCAQSIYSCVWKAMRGTDSFVLLGKPKGFYSLLSGALFALAIQLVSDDT